MIDTAKDNRKIVERAMLIGIRPPEVTPAAAAEQLEELAGLVSVFDIGIVDRMVINLKNPMPEFYVGSGKAQEVEERRQELNADCLIFDTPLSPSQQRNWERLTKCCVIDREEVILDIFAERATTREAVLQVELARLNYTLPRLTRAWTHLSRQRGGITGARGQGETQIETDRRLLRARISTLENELAAVRKQRATGRKMRERREIPHAAIVGYTNVGKSSLLRKLSDSDIFVADQLFATLDPTTRKIVLDDNQELLLTDTVGFVRKLPHSLIEAFKSTLEEAILADFLILVLDISSPQLEEQWETTLNVLHELGAEDKDIVVVFNKTDKIDMEKDAVMLARTRMLFPDSVYISTSRGDGLDVLKQRMSLFASRSRHVLTVNLPPSRHDLAALAHARGSVLNEKYGEDGSLSLVFSIGPKYQHKFAEYIAK